MRFAQRLLALQCLATAASAFPASQALLHAPAPATTSHNISATLFAELEELARIVDISYCVGVTGLGISKPFQCASRCNEFPDFELLSVSTALDGEQSAYLQLTFLGLEHWPASFRLMRLYCSLASTF